MPSTHLLPAIFLNQIIISGYSALKAGAPYLGIYGACSSFCEGLFLGGLLVDGGGAQYVVAATSSHNCTAERQFRYPTEYGAQLPPWAQHTVTGAAAVVVAARGSGPVLELATVGKVMDLGIKDPYNMGAAMAPAAADTIFTHLADTGRQPGDYDLIVTGDLGRVGRELLVELALRQGHDLSANYRDCGEIIYSREQTENRAAAPARLWSLWACCSIRTIAASWWLPPGPCTAPLPASRETAFPPLPTPYPSNSRREDSRPWVHISQLFWWAA